MLKKFNPLKLKKNINLKQKEVKRMRVAVDITVVDVINYTRVVVVIDYTRVLVYTRVVEV